jgi:hypothetical protein
MWQNMKKKERKEHADVLYFAPAVLSALRRGGVVTVSMVEVTSLPLDLASSKP